MTTTMNILMVSEEEIASDYPDPVLYEKPGEEIDELVLVNEDVFFLAPDELPQRTLTNFSIYNFEVIDNYSNLIIKIILKGFFSTLELIPSNRDIEPIYELYASGIIKEEEEVVISDVGCSSSSAMIDVYEVENTGVRIYLSQIKEWYIDCDCENVVLHLRTDACWYKLENPSDEYRPWYRVVMKIIKVTLNIINQIIETVSEITKNQLLNLKNKVRASRITLKDVIAILMEKDLDDHLFISKKVIIHSSY